MDTITQKNTHYYGLYIRLRNALLLTLKIQLKTFLPSKPSKKNTPNKVSILKIVTQQYLIDHRHINTQEIQNPARTVTSVKKVVKP